MKYKISTGWLCLVLMAVSVNVMASERLRYNPFEQPDMASDSLQANANTVSKNEMKLRGTVIDGNDSLVNIDGQFYRLNQEVAGYRVMAIKSSSVTLVRGSNEMVLTLNENNNE
jgi:hypothetical protein